MQEKILALIEESLEMEAGSLKADAMIEDIPEWDSLKFLMIISDLEDTLGVTIPIDEAVEIKSVADILKYAGE